MRSQIRSLVVTAAVFAALVLIPMPARAQAEAAIRRLPIEDWCRAEAARDIEAKMKLFTTDAVLVPPADRNVIGQQAIRAWHEKTWKGTKYQCSGTVEEVQVFGDWGLASPKLPPQEDRNWNGIRRMTQLVG